MYRYKNKLFHRRNTTIDRRNTKEHKDSALQEASDDYKGHEDPMTTKILLCRMSTKILFYRKISRR